MAAEFKFCYFLCASWTSFEKHFEQLLCLRRILCRTNAQTESSLFWLLTTSLQYLDKTILGQVRHWALFCPKQINSLENTKIEKNDFELMVLSIGKFLAEVPLPRQSLNAFSGVCFEKQGEMYQYTNGTSETAHCRGKNQFQQIQSRSRAVPFLFTENNWRRFYIAVTSKCFFHSRAHFSSFRLQWSKIFFKKTNHRRFFAKSLEGAGGPFAP